MSWVAAYTLPGSNKQILQCAALLAGQRLPHSGGAYNPQALLAAVCRHAPQFKGRQQHDSHELLRMMLDALQVSHVVLLSVPAAVCQ